MYFISALGGGATGLTSQLVKNIKHRANRESVLILLQVYYRKDNDLSFLLKILFKIRLNNSESTINEIIKILTN